MKDLRRETRLNTRQLGRLAGFSAQTVRNWEALGFLPKAERGANGYRRYTQQHVDAFEVSKSLGFAWLVNAEVMRAVHTGDVPGALAIIDAQHAELHAQRLRMRDVLVMLRTIAAQSRSIEPNDRFRDKVVLGIDAIAKQAGVRSSAIRFWESEGLLTPARDKHNGYRRYNAEQAQRARVIALLRANDVGFDVIRNVLDEMAAGDTDSAIAAATRRLDELTRRGAQILRGAALLYRYLATHYDSRLTTPSIHQENVPGTSRRSP
jgi:DNA-binding transcriptional MerR regulator